MGSGRVCLDLGPMGLTIENCLSKRVNIYLGVNVLIPAAEIACCSSNFANWPSSLPASIRRTDFQMPLQPYFLVAFLVGAFSTDKEDCKSPKDFLRIVSIKILVFHLATKLEI